MSNIVGTIVSIEELLKADEITMSISKDGNDFPETFKLCKDRKYTIPDFQREIKWEPENLSELINDISVGSKFLGNVILSKEGNQEYYIIDGQQRITMLIMLINYIKFNYGSQITHIFKPCDFNVESFSGFNDFVKNHYTLTGLDDTKTCEILDSDLYHQIEQYEKLYFSIKDSNRINNSSSARQFYNNLSRCTVNVITSNSNDTGESIEYFLDVNLKGVKLDNEDIFKAYLFDFDRTDAIRTAWKEFKANVFELNSITSESNKDIYPCMKIIEHYLYCNLYNDAKFKSLDFNEDFNLTKNFEKDGENFSIGTHVVKVIGDNSYMLNTFQNINRYLKFIIDVVESYSPSRSFSKFFCKVDDKERCIIHNIIRKTLCDAKLLLPKALIMKYILYLFSSENLSKTQIKQIYSIFFLNTMFTLFETKKEKNSILNILKSSKWQDKVVSHIKSYFERENIVTNKFTSQYKYATDINNDEQKYRCKSLAAIYNFFEITNDKVCIKNRMYSELHKFLTDDYTFSVEHFVINDGKSMNVIKPNGNEYSYAYISETKKYAKSIFNFIFIPDELNRNDLGNVSVKNKNKRLSKINIDEEIKCEYSKMVIQIAKSKFEENVDINNDDDTIKQKYDEYFSYKFKNEYNDFVDEILNKIINKFKLK